MFFFPNRAFIIDHRRSDELKHAITEEENYPLFYLCFYVEYFVYHKLTLQYRSIASDLVVVVVVVVEERPIITSVTKKQLYYVN